jgi:hypothetical protein
MPDRKRRLYTGFRETPSEIPFLSWRIVHIARPLTRIALADCSYDRRANSLEAFLAGVDQAIALR